jgi:hypothetical protein
VKGKEGKERAVDGKEEGDEIGGRNAPSSSRSARSGPTSSHRSRARVLERSLFVRKGVRVD